MKFVIEYNDNMEIKIDNIDIKICSKFIDWWNTGRINDTTSDIANVLGIGLNRYNVKSIKFER